MSARSKLADFMDEAYKEKSSEKKGYGKREERKKGSKKLRRKKDKEKSKEQCEDLAKKAIGKTKRILDQAMKGLKKETEQWADDVERDLLADAFTGPKGTAKIKKTVELDDDLTGSIKFEIGGDYDIKKVEKVINKHAGVTGDPTETGIGKRKVLLVSIPFDLMEE